MSIKSISQQFHSLIHPEPSQKGVKRIVDFTPKEKKAPVSTKNEQPDPNASSFEMVDSKRLI